MNLSVVLPHAVSIVKILRTWLIIAINFNRASATPGFGWNMFTLDMCLYLFRIWKGCATSTSATWPSCKQLIFIIIIIVICVLLFLCL